MTTKTTESGLLLVDKPSGWTSHDVVAKIRSLAGTRRVGHAGTLDPMATGLLVIGINSATKLLTFLVGADKTYEATIRLGAATVTDDAQGETTFVAEQTMVNVITDGEIQEGVATLTGRISQIPSAVSAIKVDGQRAYAKVRAGESVELAAREVLVSRFDLVGKPSRVAEDDSVFIDLKVIVECSSGTYIRALARDLGSYLGIGGHLTALKRTRVGAFKLEDAFKVDEPVDSLPLIRDSQAVVGQFAIRRVSNQEVVDLRHGKRLALGQIEAARLDSLAQPKAHASAGAIAALSDSGKLVAILEVSGNQLKSQVVFAADALNGVADD